MSPNAWILLLLIPASIGLFCMFLFSILDQVKFARESRASEDAIDLPSPMIRRVRAAVTPLPMPMFHVFAIMLATLVTLMVTELFEDQVLAGTLAFIVTLYLTYSVAAGIGLKRSIKFEERLVDAIDIMASTLKGSENPRQALDSASRVVPGPVGPELREVTRRLEMGMDIRRALMRIQANFDSEGVRMFCSTLSAKWATGGDLAPTLVSVNRLIRERLRHRLRVRSRLAGANISAWIVAISPYFIVAALMYFHPIWLHRLMAHPTGAMLIIAAISCQAIGFLWLRRMMRVEM